MPPRAISPASWYLSAGPVPAGISSEAGKTTGDDGSLSGSGSRMRVSSVGSLSRARSTLAGAPKPAASPASRAESSE